MTENTETNRADAVGNGTPRGSTKRLDAAGSEAAELEAHIARTREDLARTVDQLAAKLDVKTRVRTRAADARAGASYKLQDLRHRATDAEGRPTRAVMAVAGGTVAALVAVVVVGAWRRNGAGGRRGWRR